MHAWKLDGPSVLSQVREAAKSHSDQAVLRACRYAHACTRAPGTQDLPRIGHTHACPCTPACLHARKPACTCAYVLEGKHGAGGQPIQRRRHVRSSTVCVRARICACMCVRAHARTHTHAHVCVCACACVCACTRVRMRARVHVRLHVHEHVSRRLHKHGGSYGRYKRANVVWQV